MNFKTLGTIFILSFFLLGCNILSFQERIEKKKKEEKILEDWKKDSLGCKGLRKMEHARYITDTLNLYNKSKKFVISKIGNPDTLIVEEDIILNDNGKIKEVKNVKILRYYFGTPCKNGLIYYSGSEYCAVEIWITSNKVKLAVGGCK